MDVIKPITIEDSMLTSNVATGDYSDWSAGSYTAGTTLVYYPDADTAVFNTIYVATTTTSDDPLTGLEQTVPTWVRQGYINKWRMFESNTGTVTSNLETIDVDLVTGELVNSVALFGLTGYEFTVVMTDPVEGEVYNETVDIVDFYVDNMYDFFFEPYGQIKDFVLLDLPAYPDATVSVTVNNYTGEDAECAVCVVGKVTELGYANHGTSISTIDYSVREVDDFGNYQIVERKKVKKVNFQATVPTVTTNSIQRFMNDISTLPAVFIGAEDRQATIILGYYRDWDIKLDSRTWSSMNIEVEGV